MDKQNETIIAINATFGKTASAEKVGLEAKVKASMKAVLDGNWMTTDDDVLFRSGLAGVLMDVGTESEDGQRLVKNIDFLRKFGSFISAASAGLDVAFPEMNLPTEDVVPLMGWWHEVKDQK